MVYTVLASGVIEDAPSVNTLLLRVLGFLLEVFGILAILGVIGVGVWYLFVSDDKKRLLAAKQAFFNVLIGVAAVLGALVIFRQIVSYF